MENKMTSTQNNTDAPTEFARFIADGYTIAIEYDSYSGPTDLDPTVFAETIERYNRGELWDVIITATDTLTRSTTSLGGVSTEDMLETDDATFHDLDPYGLGVALELLRELHDGAAWIDGHGNVVQRTGNRAQRLVEYVATLRVQADDLEIRATEEARHR